MPIANLTAKEQPVIATVDAYILLEKYAQDQHINITDLVIEAHAQFAQDEPYSDFVPHQNDRWHNFLNFSVRVFECTESSGDRNQDIKALLGWFVSKHAIETN